MCPPLRLRTMPKNRYAAVIGVKSGSYKRQSLESIVGTRVHGFTTHLRVYKYVLVFDGNFVVCIYFDNPKSDCASSSAENAFERYMDIARGSFNFKTKKKQKQTPVNY